MVVSRYVVKEMGPHSIEVMYQGAQIPDSPFKINAIKGRDATRVYADGPGLKEGVMNKEAYFTGTNISDLLDNYSTFLSYKRYWSAQKSN